MLESEAPGEWVAVTALDAVILGEYELLDEQLPDWDPLLDDEADDEGVWLPLPLPLPLDEDVPLPDALLLPLQLAEDDIDAVDDRVGERVLALVREPVPLLVGVFVDETVAVAVREDDAPKV